MDRSLPQSWQTRKKRSEPLPTCSSEPPMATRSATARISFAASRMLCACLRACSPAAAAAAWRACAASASPASVTDASTSPASPARSAAASFSAASDAAVLAASSAAAASFSASSAARSASRARPAAAAVASGDGADARIDPGASPCIRSIFMLFVEMNRSASDRKRDSRSARFASHSGNRSPFATASSYLRTHPPTPSRRHVTPLPGHPARAAARRTHSSFRRSARFPHISCLHRPCVNSVRSNMSHTQNPCR